MDLAQRHRRLVVAATIITLTATIPIPTAADEARGTRGIVATAHPLATQAALDAFAAGGNAVDATVAACLTLGVVDPANSGIGGGCFMLLALADGRRIVLDGRETAPAAATSDMFLRDGKADTTASQVGPLAAGVPGALAAYAEAVRRFGRRSLADALRPAATIADGGFPIDSGLARKIVAESTILRSFPATRAVFFHPDGTPVAAGEPLRQPELAAAYRRIADEGPDWFYRGGFAAAVGDWMAAHGGIMTAADLAAYAVVERQPLTTTYHGFTILLMPPPSSGGVHVAQMLRMLERFDLAALDEPGLREHLLTESMKLAFADRAYWLGDPAYTKVPRGLVDDAYCGLLAARIDPTRATTVAGHGMPPDSETAVFGAGRHTTHLSVADAEGNWVACTATLNTHFGSGVIVPGTGILLNNEMDDFSIEPGVPNAFGLVGGAANAVAPGKRPLSSMSPTIVLADDRPIIALGGAGGPTIITQTVQHLVQILDLHASPAAALAAPRLHHQWRPDTLAVERSLPEAVRATLAARGHALDERRSIGVSQIVARAADGTFRGASDPRSGGTAAGW